MPNRNSRKERAPEQPVRLMAIYADGRVSHRDLTKGRAPWNSGAAWGRAGAHALPDEAPAPVLVKGKAKDPKKVAAGKARAAQAQSQRVGGKFVKTATVTVPKTKRKAASPFPGVAKTGRAAKGTAAPSPSSDAMVVVAFRASQEQKDKLASLGGGEWMRARIDAATVRK
jgi:hypothetical protein